MAESMMMRGQNAEGRERRFCCGYAAQPYKVHRVAVHNILYSVFCILYSGLCYAEELPDPTRPPTAIAIPATGIVGNAPSGLQSVIISKNRRAAIIDGETVELGGKHGGATLIEVTEGGVVLQGAQGRQVLTLFPDVRMMKKEIQAAPKLPVEEGGVAQKTKLEASKERK